jgi:S-adenosyl-L-methionine hydrolase (adenosine-forming)
MPPPIVTLTTDFGLADHFVGVVKGVILGICPQAQIVDISHEVTPFATAEGAYLIAQAYPYFPKNTVHLVVVDPGVGSTRRPILMEAAQQYFVAPDNGVLGMIYPREKHQVRAITNCEAFLQPVSHTFHGRDIFAPVAAHLAAGAAPATLGKKITDYRQPPFAMPKPAGRHRWRGFVLRIDRFGNIVTNFVASDFPDLQNFEIKIGRRRVRTLATSYANGGPAELFAIVGSSGYLEISVNQASAAKVVGCGAGSSVEITFR